MPRNSLLSVQVHESALNNTLEQLKLEGKRYEIRELYRELADAFNRTELEIPEEVPEGVYVQFASRNAIRVQCDDNRVVLTLRIAELKRDRRNIRAFSACESTTSPTLRKPMRTSSGMKNGVLSWSVPRISGCARRSPPRLPKAARSI